MNCIESRVLRQNGCLMRVWTFEPCNCEDIHWGEATARSYDEERRRFVLHQRGFDPSRPIQRVRMSLGDVQYRQVIAL